jgi:CRP-like cAMP-binding protein
MQVRSTLRTSSNKLLARLPAADYQRLLPVLHPISLPFQRVLLKPGETVQTIYFPGDGVCSITQTMRTGRTVEVASVGNEGFIGINALFGCDRALGGTLVNIADASAHAMTVKAFRREMKRRGPFSKLINGYAQAFVAALVQSVACSSLHSVEERCARWLLTTSDRLARKEFPLTQAFLADLMGVRRSTVTLAINALKSAGLVDHRHGHIVILDRAGLDAVACECYGVVKRHFCRLPS